MIGVATPEWGLEVVPLVDMPAGVPAIELRTWRDFPGGPQPPPPEGAPGRGTAVVNWARQFATIPHVVAVVGHGGSRESLVASRVYHDSQIVQLVPTGTSRLLGDAGGWTFALPPDDSLEGLFIADYLADRLRATRAAVFFTNDEYGTGLRDGVTRALSEKAVPVVAAIPVFGPTSDFDVLVEATLARTPFDAAVVAGRPLEALGVARALHRHRPGTPVVAGDGTLVRGELQGSEGPEYDMLRIVGFWTPDRADSASRAFVRRFRARHGKDPDAGNAMTFDALSLIVAAIRDVGGRSHAIRDYLRSLGRSRPAFRGITGSVTFGSRRANGFVVVRLEDGEVVTAADGDGPS